MIFTRTSLVLALTLASLSAQPTVTKVEPPTWITPIATKTIRVLIHGTQLKDAKATVPAPLSTAHTQTNEAGTYLFTELAINNAPPGSYPITISTSTGTVTAPFSIVSPPQKGFAGFNTNDVIYLIMPDRFANGDPSNDDPTAAKGLLDRSKPRYYHGGDLQGITDHLDYIKSLGATTVWINPWYTNNPGLNEREKYDGQPITDYHGYGAVDFYGVDPHLGDLKTLQTLVATAHGKGLKIMQDQVANHTGPYHPWTQDSPTPTWYHGNAKKHLANDFITWPLMDPYATPESKRKVLDGWFIDILPDMNQDDREARRYLIENSLWWVGVTGLDAIRQDTLPYAPRDYWRDWTTALTQNFPNVNVVGEVFDGDPAFTSFFQGGVKRFDGLNSGVQSVFDFPLYFALRKTFGNNEPLRNIPQVLSHDRLYPNPNLLVTFLGLHDVQRFMSEPKASIEDLKLAYTTLLTTRGVPMIYYGDEIGMQGGNDPENRRDFPGGWSTDQHNAFVESQRTASENEIWKRVQKLIALRKATPALRGAAHTTNLYSTEQQWAFTRSAAGSTAIVVINNDKNAATITCGGAPSGIYTDKLGALGSTTIQNGQLNVTLPAKSAAVLVH